MISNPLSSSTSTEKNIEDDVKFLWRDVKRRPKHKATGENMPLMSEVKHILHARILTGRAHRHFTNPLWPDLRHELDLSEFIGKIWRERRAIRVEENRKMGRDIMPSELPLPEEARQVCHRNAYFIKVQCG
jgi:hypothetical protein